MSACLPCRACRRAAHHAPLPPARPAAPPPAHARPPAATRTHAPACRRARCARASSAAPARPPAPPSRTCTRLRHAPAGGAVRASCPFGCAVGRDASSIAHISPFFDLAACHPCIIGRRRAPAMAAAGGLEWCRRHRRHPPAGRARRLPASHGMSMVIFSGGAPGARSRCLPVRGADVYVVTMQARPSCNRVPCPLVMPSSILRSIQQRQKEKRPRLSSACACTASCKAATFRRRPRSPMLCRRMRLPGVLLDAMRATCSRRVPAIFYMKTTLPPHRPATWKDDVTRKEGGYGRAGVSSS